VRRRAPVVLVVAWMMHSEAKNTRARSFVFFLFCFGFRVFCVCGNSCGL
jgi:hypothetical protein